MHTSEETFTVQTLPSDELQQMYAARQQCVAELRARHWDTVTSMLAHILANPVADTMRISDVAEADSEVVSGGNAANTPTALPRTAFSGYSPEEVLRSVRALVELGEATPLIQLLEAYLSQYALAAADHIHSTMANMRRTRLSLQSPSSQRRRWRESGGTCDVQAVCDNGALTHTFLDVESAPPAKSQAGVSAHVCDAMHRSSFRHGSTQAANSAMPSPDNESRLVNFAMHESTTNNDDDRDNHHDEDNKNDSCTCMTNTIDTACDTEHRCAGVTRAVAHHAPERGTSGAGASSAEVGLYAFGALSTLWQAFDAHIQEVMTVWVYLQHLSLVGATRSLDALAVQCMHSALSTYGTIMEAALEGYQQTVQADLRHYGTLRHASVFDRSVRQDANTANGAQASRSAPCNSLLSASVHVLQDRCIGMADTANIIDCDHSSDGHTTTTQDHDPGVNDSNSLDHSNHNNPPDAPTSPEDKPATEAATNRCLLRSFLSLTMAIEQYFSRVQPLVLAIVSQHYNRCASAALTRASSHTLHGAHYFALAAAAISEERDRVRAYLHPHTLPALEEIAQRVLIEYAGRRILEVDLAEMIEQREYEGLTRAWSLIARGSYVQDDGFVTRLFRNYIEETGKRYMSQLPLTSSPWSTLSCVTMSTAACAGEADVSNNSNNTRSNDADTTHAATNNSHERNFGVVKAIINLIQTGEEVIRRSFGEDQRAFTVQLYEAIESTLHNNVQRFSEQLAVYLHTTMMDVCSGVLPLHRGVACHTAALPIVAAPAPHCAFSVHASDGSNDNSNKEVATRQNIVCAEEVLHGIGTVFAHHPQKNVFESLYWSQLANRLLRGPRHSAHVEEWCFVRILAHACGSTFAAKYENMLKDMTTSAKLDDMYITWSNKQQHQQHAKKGSSNHLAEMSSIYGTTGHPAMPEQGASQRCERAATPDMAHATLCTARCRNAEAEDGQGTATSTHNTLPTDLLPSSHAHTLAPLLESEQLCEEEEEEEARRAQEGPLESNNTNSSLVTRGAHRGSNSNNSNHAATAVAAAAARHDGEEALRQHSSAAPIDGTTAVPELVHTKLQLYVLNGLHWPSYTAVALILPPRWGQLAAYVQSFCRQSFPNCRLTWHHELSTAVLRVRRERLAAQAHATAPDLSTQCAMLSSSPLISNNNNDNTIIGNDDDLANNRSCCDSGHESAVRCESDSAYYDMSGTVIQAAVLLVLDAALNRDETELHRQEEEQQPQHDENNLHAHMTESNISHTRTEHSNDKHIPGMTHQSCCLSVGELCRRLQLDPSAPDVVESIGGLTQEPCKVLQMLPAHASSSSHVATTETTVASSSVSSSTSSSGLCVDDLLTFHTGFAPQTAHVRLRLMPRARGGWGAGSSHLAIDTAASSGDIDEVDDKTQKARNTLLEIGLISYMKRHRTVKYDVLVAEMAKSVSFPVTTAAMKRVLERAITRGFVERSVPHSYTYIS